MPSTIWQDIRALRAKPTGLAATDPDRARTFKAALQQAEELAVAASAISYAASPLPLFYALSQGGRAVAAAHLTSNWEIKGHGLSCKYTGLGDVLEAVMSPARGRQEAFQSVAVALQSPQLAGPASLGALWAANPDLRNVAVPAGLGDRPPALSCPLGTRATDPNQALATGGMVAVRVDVPGTTAAEVLEALKPYPSLAKLRPLKQGPLGDVFADDGDVVVRSTDPDGTSKVTVASEAPMHTTHQHLWDMQDQLFSVVEVDEDQPTRPHPAFVGVAMPAVGGGPAPHPLMLWWALLLGLSSLTRYHPAAWTSAVDLDASVLAVPLQQVLDVAADRVPARILDALG